MHLVSQKKSPKSVRRAHHWRSLIRNTVVVEHLACRAVARIQAIGEQFRNAFMQIFIYWPALVFAGGFCLLDALGLSLPALFIILARDRGHHFHQHGINRAQHPAGELVTLCVLDSLMARRQVERNDAKAFGVDRSLELLPILHRPSHFEDDPLAPVAAPPPAREKIAVGWEHWILHGGREL